MKRIPNYSFFLFAKILYSVLLKYHIENMINGTNEILAVFIASLNKNNIAL